MTIISPIGAASQSCRDHYIAEIWSERRKTSTTDYVLLGFGWVRRSCGDESYQSAAIDEARLMDERVRGVLDSCRNRAH